VPRIDQAIRAQLDKIAHTTLLGLASEPSIRLAAELVTRAPHEAGQAPLNKVFYSDAGATAVEVALKMAAGYWYHRGHPERRKFIALGGAYHGDTTGSMSVGYSELFHRPFAGMVFPVLWAPAPDACRLSVPGAATPAGLPSQDPVLAEALRAYCLKELDRMLEEHGAEVAAVLIEPVMQGAAGMICQPPGFVRGVADLARRHGVLFIADEVATGFGRTGTMFACQHDAVTPDIMCLAKGITGGYLPLAATLCTDEVEQAFCGPLEAGRTFYHGHTYTGNALACAAAVASLELFDETDLLGHIGKSAAIIAERLKSLHACPHVRDIRQRGIMTGIELCRDRQRGEAFDFSARTGSAVCQAMRERGLILRPLGDVVVLNPIPAMPHDVLKQMLDIVVETIAGWRV
jgi:adenosylmethionine-8-amino-7-oxononanoate aminotransferase